MVLSDISDLLKIDHFMFFSKQFNQTDSDKLSKQPLFVYSNHIHPRIIKQKVGEGECRHKC